MAGLVLRIAALTAATGCIAFGAVESAVACSPVEYSDNGRYVGGDLIHQISDKADLIQLVRVTEKRLVTRTYSLGRRYLDFGETELPPDWPEYTDHFVFTLVAVDTLKGRLEGEPWMIEDPLRVAGYGFSVLRPHRDVGTPGERPHPNRLPEWVFSRPANDGFAFSGANEGSGLGGGECNPPYFMEVGQLFVALRRSDGRLYPVDAAFPLEIDAELRQQRGGWQRRALRMQSLIPVSSPNDPLIENLRQSIAGLE